MLLLNLPRLGTTEIWTATCTEHNHAAPPVQRTKSLQTAATPPGCSNSPQAVSFSPGQFPWFYTEHSVIWYGIPLWLVWVPSPDCVPPCFQGKLTLSQLNPAQQAYKGLWRLQSPHELVLFSKYSDILIWLPKKAKYIGREWNIFLSFFRHNCYKRRATFWLATLPP